MGRIRLLLAGTNADHVEELRLSAIAILGHEVDVLAVETSDGSSDPELAWGTKHLHVRQLAPDLSVDCAPSVEEPLGEDGDVWKALMEAAHRYEIDVIVIGAPEQGWLGRLLVGSAAQDLLTHSDVPVLVIPSSEVNTAPGGVRQR
jgi:nucleotide-binding universal stress UspA family protein